MNRIKENVDTEIKKRLMSDFLKRFIFGSNREKFCDFTIVVGDTEFPCHRFVLSPSSGFFEALLRSDMKERREMKATIHGISPDIFKLILDVIYGSFEVLVPDKMIDIWKAAHQLQVHSLISACEEYFIKNITAENSYLIYTQAQFLQSPKVSSSVLNYMIQNFAAFVQTENFVKIDFKDFMEILQNDHLKVSADSRIEAILKWCESENKNNTSERSNPGQGSSRLRFLGTLFQTVNLAQLTTKCLAGLLVNRHVQGDPTANEAVISQAAMILGNHTSQIDRLRKMSNYRYSSCDD